MNQFQDVYMRAILIDVPSNKEICVCASLKVNLFCSIAQKIEKKRQTCINRWWLLLLAHAYICLTHISIIITIELFCNLSFLFPLALDLKAAVVTEGAPSGKADTTITVSDADFIDIALGKINPQQAFMKGKLKIQGNIMLAQKLGPLLKTEAKL